MKTPTPRRDEYAGGASRRRYALLVEEVEIVLERDTDMPKERGPFMSRIIDLAPWRNSGDDPTWG